MKKTISLSLAIIMCLSMCLSLCGCKSENKAITLTTENIDQYIAIVATYNNYRENNALYSGIYYSWCDIDLQAYGTTPGTFSNVEITFSVDIPLKEWLKEYPWFPAGGHKGDPVQFTFRLPTTGEYSHAYQIECDGVSSELAGNCKFTIVSVTGTFTPA